MLRARSGIQLISPLTASDKDLGLCGYGRSLSLAVKCSRKVEVGCEGVNQRCFTQIVMRFTRYSYNIHDETSMVVYNVRSVGENTANLNIYRELRGMYYIPHRESFKVTCTYFSHTASTVSEWGDPLLSPYPLTTLSRHFYQVKSERV